MIIQERLDLEIFLVCCPHMVVLCLDDSEWCDFCHAWIVGKSVADLAVVWRDDGDIFCMGDGFADRGLLEG